MDKKRSEILDDLGHAIRGAFTRPPTSSARLSIVMTGLLFGINAHDPGSYAAMIVAVCIVAAGASARAHQTRLAREPDCCSANRLTSSDWRWGPTPSAN